MNQLDKIESNTEETKIAVSSLQKAYWVALGVIGVIAILSLVLSILSLVNLASVKSSIKNDTHDAIWEYFNQYEVEVTK